MILPLLRMAIIGQALERFYASVMAASISQRTLGRSYAGQRFIFPVIEERQCHFGGKGRNVDVVLSLGRTVRFLS
jgi:hypothetical protein